MGKTFCRFEDLLYFCRKKTVEQTIKLEMTLEEMKKRILLMVLTALLLGVSPLAAQGLKRVYNEQADAALQVDSALTVARDAGKLVVCQVGGNWCPWCLKFADFITSDNEIAQLVEKNFVYIHVNYARGTKDEATLQVMRRLGNPQRFGFPVLVVLRPDGSVAHIQDSSFLEQDKSYDRNKVLRFFKCWTPAAMGTN